MKELDYMNEVSKNPLLAYTLLHTIDKFQHEPYIAREILAKFDNYDFKRDEPRYALTPSRFYRILFLINKNCEKKGLELRLPYYWCKSGPVVHRRDAPHVFSVVRIAKSQHVVASYDKWKDTVLIFDGYESSFSDSILLTLEAANLARFTRLDVIFEHSPNNLHKAMVTMIRELQNVTKKEFVDETDFNTVSKMLANIIDECAKTRNSELYSSFEQAAEKLQTQLAAQSNMHNVLRVIQDMWDIVSLGLRAEENVNINKKQVQKWERTYALALEAFSKRLFLG
ncbi:MAG: hypothetical protein ACXV5H_07500 [Halobacteriota archaeon]